MRYLFLLISFIAAITYSVPVRSQFLPPISFNNFFKIASEGDLQGLKNAQRRGLNINSVNQNGDTAICIAIKQKNYLAYRTLLRAGAKSNPDCVTRIPEYSHKAFLNNYNKQYGVQKNYLSSSKKWQSFLIGAGIAGGVGAALAGGGGGGGSGNNNTSPPSFDDIGNTDKCELNKCAEGCYTDLTCSTDEYCAQYNNCGGCEQCKKIEKCLINECAEGCYTNLTCPTGQKCAEKNNCNGCERCEDIPVCHTENKCQHPECYTNLQVPPGYECIKRNDCGGCEGYEQTNSCSTVTGITFNPISHSCVQHYDICPSKCKEIVENETFEVNNNFEQCVSGYEIDGKCYKKETTLDIVSCNLVDEVCAEGFTDENGYCHKCISNEDAICDVNPNYEVCAEGYEDENGDCHKCIINTSNICNVNPNYEVCAEGYEDENGDCHKCTINISNICIVNPNYEVCAEGYEDENGNCHKCIINEDTICDDNPNYAQCEEGFTDKNGNCHKCTINEDTICDINPNYEVCAKGFTDQNGNCHRCIINTSSICDVNPNYEQCEEGYEDENGDCHSCIANKAECTPESGQICSAGFYDEETGKCYNCINGYEVSNNATITKDNTFNIQENIPVKKIDYTTGKINEEEKTVQINVFGFRANSGGSNPTTDCENCPNMDVYNAKTADGEINLDYSTQAKKNVIGLHSYQGAYNAYNGNQGTISIKNAIGHVFGIYAIGYAYNAYDHSTGIINIEVGDSIYGSIYGMYSHSQKAINSHASQATITIKNEHEPQKEIFGIFNGSMSINDGEGTIEIIDNQGSQNIYGIYNGNMAGNYDNINISSDKNGPDTQKIVGIHKDDSEKTNGKIIITNTGKTFTSDQVVGIEYTGASKFDASGADLQITGGLYETVGISSSAPITYAPTITISDTLSDFNSIVAVTNQLNNLYNAELTLNDIEITNQNSNFSKIIGVQTNNPNIIIGEDKLISISSAISSRNMEIYGILYNNEIGNQTFNLSANGSDVDKNKINMSISGSSEATKSVSVVGLGFLNTNLALTLIDESLNNIPITITSTGSSNTYTSFYGIKAENINFTNNGEISATINSGDLYGIYIEGNINNTANISLKNDNGDKNSGDLYGIYTIEGNINNTANISLKNDNGDKNFGLYGYSDKDNQYYLTNSGTLQISRTKDTYGIYAKNYDSVINDVGGNISGAKYGIYVSDVYKTENKASIEALNTAIDVYNSKERYAVTTFDLTNSGALKINGNGETKGICAENYSSVINDVGGNISGAKYGIYVTDVWKTENKASIEALNTAIYANNTSEFLYTSLYNLTTLKINGTEDTYGIYAENYSSVINDIGGNISGAKYGIYVTNDYKTENRASINASSTAIYADGNGESDSNLTNSGNLQINGTGDTSGIQASNYASIINNVGGDISGAKYGIYAEDVNTIENKASIEASDTAIYANKTSEELSSQYTISNVGKLQINGTGDTYGIQASNYDSIINNVGGDISGAKYGIYAENVNTIENKSSIEASDIAIYANKTSEELSSQYTISNVGKLQINGTGDTYGIYANNYNEISNTGDIIGAKYGIYAENVNTIYQSSQAKINSSYIGIYNSGTGTEIIDISGRIGYGGTRPEIAIYSDNTQNITFGNISDSDSSISATNIGIYSSGGDITNNGRTSAGRVGIYSLGGNVTNNGDISVWGEYQNDTEVYGIYGRNLDFENGGTTRTKISNNGKIKLDIHNNRPSYNPLNIKAFGIYAGQGVDVENTGSISITNSGCVDKESWFGGIYLSAGSTLINSGVISLSTYESTYVSEEKGTMFAIFTEEMVPEVSSSYSVNTANGNSKIYNTGSIHTFYAEIWKESEYFGLGVIPASKLEELYQNGTDIRSLKDRVVAEDGHVETGCDGNCIIIDKYIYASYGSNGFKITPTVDISNYITTSAASMSTTGAFRTDMALDLTSLGMSKFGVGKNGTIEAPSIAGNITAETSIVEEGFDTTYTNEESFIGDVSGVNLVSESALFNAELIEKGNNTADIVMTMKQFEDVVENESVAQYLQNNYTHKNNEKLFSQLKSFETSAEINSHLNKELGLSLLPNFTQENLQIFRSLNGLIIDDMFSKNLTDERMLVGYDYMAQERKSKGHITGYDNNSNSSYFLADTELNKKSRFGAGMSITQFDSDYDDNSSRDETFVSALASYMYKFNPNLKYAGVARLGYGFGDYNRNTSTNGYKANLHDVVYGLTNQLRYAYNMKYFTLEPQVDFNILGYYQRNMKEQIKNNSLHVASTNNLSVETGVGLYASKSAKFNEWTNLKARLGAGYYRELADPYHDMKVSLRGMNGYYKTDASPIFDRDRYLLNADVNLDWKQFNFYIRANWFIENDDTAIINAGIKYNF